MVAITNKRFLSALVLFVNCASSKCFSFTSSNDFRLTRSISPGRGSSLVAAVKPPTGRSLLLQKLRGGGNLEDDGNDRTLSSSAPSQLSMMAAVVPSSLKVIKGSIVGALGFLLRDIKSLTSSQKLLLGATFVFGFAMGRMRPFWKRYTSVNDIPQGLFGSTAPTLRGRAVSISDGDTIRFLHQPTRWFHPSALQKGQKVSEFALPVRLCTIDTPETAKFGKPGQPFGEEAKQHLKSLLEDKVVYVRLLQKDQYSRAVAEVFIKRAIGGNRYMDAEMLQEGLAEVYTGGGAVYGPLGKEEYMAIEEKARKAKKGIWSQENRETAAEYKRRTKE